MFSFRHLLILWFNSKRVRIELKINLNQFFTQIIAQKLVKIKIYSLCNWPNQELVIVEGLRFLKSIYWFVTFGQNFTLTIWMLIWGNAVLLDCWQWNTIKNSTTVEDNTSCFYAEEESQKQKRRKKGYVIQSWHPLRLSLICSIM